MKEAKNSEPELSNTKLFTLYIPKYKESFHESVRPNMTRGTWPLPYEIGQYISNEIDVDTLIVSPGYMSCNPRTCLAFLTALEDEMFLRDIDENKTEARRIDVGLLRGINGHNNIRADDKKKLSSEYASLERDITYLELHEIESEILPDEDFLLARSMVPMHPVKDDKGNNKIPGDHRKQIFLINSNGAPLSKLIDDAENMDSGKIDLWLQAIDVKAMCIGSSNFSFRTYFGEWDKNEADIFMFPVNNPDDAVKDCGTYFGGLVKRIQEMSEMRMGENAISSFGNVPNGRVLSQEYVMAPKSHELFFKSLLRDLLMHSLLLNTK